MEREKRASGSKSCLLFPLHSSWLVSAHSGGKHAQGNRIAGSEVFRRPEAARNEIAIFLDVALDLVGGQFVRAKVGLTRENDNIATGAVAIKVERDTRIVLQVLQAFRVGQAINKKLRARLVPQKPDRRWLRRPFLVNGSQPDNHIVTQAACDPLAKRRRWVWKLKCHDFSFLTKGV